MSHVEVTLERDGFNQPWGLRMLGGVDVGSPLTVSRVIAGTASEGVLRVGDVITAIKGQDATCLSHQEATELFKSAGNQLDLVLARGVSNGTLGTPETPGTPRTTMVDGPFGKGHSAQPKPNQVGKPPARKFSDRRLQYLVPQSFKNFQTVQSPTSYLPATTFVKPKSKMELQVEEAILQEHHEKDMIVDQPYRTTPLITPGAKVKRDTPIVASYLNMHPDPQVRGAAPHVSQVSSGLNSMLGSANEQLARKVATNVRNAAQDRPDSGRVHTPKIIHHQFNTPANLYSQDNMASSIQQQTGIAPQVSGAPRKEFSIQNSETLKMILEEDQQKPATQHKPKSHVVYDVHEAKAVNQPPSMFTNSDKIAQSYSFNKLMWSVDPVERL